MSLSRCYVDMPEFPEVLKIVREFFDNDPEKIWLWFETNNPLLGNVSPADMLALGRGEKLLKCIRNWRAGEMP